MRAERTVSLLLRRMKESVRGDKMQAEARPRTGTRTRLWYARTLTCRIVIEGVRVLFGAVASEEGFVVVILVPVERLDLQPPTLGVTTDNAGHGLVDLGGGAGDVHVGQKHHLLPHVTPALRAEQLGSGCGEKTGGGGKRAKDRARVGAREEKQTVYFLNPKATFQNMLCLKSLSFPAVVNWSSLLCLWCWDLQHLITRLSQTGGSIQHLPEERILAHSPPPWLTLYTYSAKCP